MKSTESERMRQYFQDWNRYETQRILAPKPKVSQCECGVDKVGQGRHSKWCEKSDNPKEGV